MQALEVWFKIAPMTGIVFWMCLFWRRVTVAGAWASTLSGFGAWWLTTKPYFVDFAAGLPHADSLRLIWTENSKASIYDPWQILFYLTAAMLAGVLVSLVTRPVDPKKLDRFYTLIRTPIGRGEEIEEPCTLPPDAPPPRPALFSGLGFEIPRPSRTSVIGFLVGWLCVAALIGGFVLLIQA